ncbi:MAG: acyltransferase family protein [Novosphingobium sp.]|jgi:glucan biosynthesis protein C|uniref:acyltransferase family protein n=1 Tax=Novosphingobium sp. TaxID=1874826 RepID=UPI00391B1980|nr:acyltransferase family protein [Novosphingobium sp.]
MQAVSANNGRQFGLDWLRIGAFGLLIFYHIGMFFVPWGWHIKTAEPLDWVQWPMLAINPWRLSLLFLISGVVSRSLMVKLARPDRFATSRSARLLIPLLAGMVIFVAPQPWFELRDKGAYTDGFLDFWLHDYPEFGASRGTPLPTWNHLWFVAYLWAYSMALALLASLPARNRAILQRAFDWLFSGWRLFVLPIAWLALARVILLPAFGETHALVDDPYAHAIYGFAFFFGVGLARSASAWTAILANWKLALVVALLACVPLFYIHGSGVEAAILTAAKSVVRATLAWAMILGLLGLAQTYLHYDGPVRRYLTEAIFPYYIVHQTIIIAVGCYLKQVGAGSLVEFIGILLATFVGCALTYEIGRRTRWLRPMLGLKAGEPVQEKRKAHRLAA